MDIGSCRPRANKWFQSIVCRDRHWELRPNERKTWCCWESVSNDEMTAAAPISDHETKGKIQAIFRSPRRHTDRRDKSCIRWHYQWRQPQPSILVLSCLVLSWFMVVPVRAWCRRSGPLEGRSVLWGENEMAEGT